MRCVNTHTFKSLLKRRQFLKLCLEAERWRVISRQPQQKLSKSKYNKCCEYYTVWNDLGLSDGLDIVDVHCWRCACACVYSLLRSHSVRDWASVTSKEVCLISLEGLCACDLLIMSKTSVWIVHRMLSVQALSGCSDETPVFADIPTCSLSSL